MTDKNFDIQEFSLSIDNMLSSKYILIDRRISDILHAIVESEDVYKVIAKAMINFDFEYEWKVATAGRNFIKFSEDDNKNIAFIFCLLNNMDKRNIDATFLLENYFSADSQFSPYELFCRQVIETFRTLIFGKLGVEVASPKETHETQAARDSQPAEPEDLLNKLAALKKQLMSAKIKSDMEKSDLGALIDSFERAVLRGDVDYYYAFVTSLKCSLKKQKNVRALMQDIFKLSIELTKRSN